MRKVFWSKRFSAPKLFILGLAVCLALGVSATALAGGKIEGDDIYKFSDDGAVKGGIYRTSWATMRSFDPAIGTASDGTSFGNIVYNGLLRLTQNMKDIELDLAESWRQIDDLTYEFKLRKGVHFQDVPPVNGRECTSADVKYSIERMAGKIGTKSKFKHTYYFDKLASIETPDKYTIIFKTSEPYAPFINYIASAWTKIVPKEAVDEYKTLDLKGIGTGPFTLVEHVRGSHMTFKRNDKFFKKGLPRLDGMSVKFMPQPATYVSAFLAGELDTTGLPENQVDTVLKEDPNSNIYIYPGAYTRILRTPPWWEGKVPLEPPFNDKRVRQAIAHAIDKTRLLKLAHNGDGQVQIGPVPRPYVPWALSEKDQTEFNPELSKKLLAEAGYPNGFSTELMTWNLYYMTTPAQIIKEMLADVGINVTINALDFAQYFNKTYRYKYQMAFHITTAGYDPEEWLVPYFGNPEKATYYKWSNHELWDLIAQQSQIMDKEKRVAAIHKIQRMVMDEAMSQSMLTTNYHLAFKPYVHPKIFLHEGSGYAGIDEAWMEKH